VVTGDTFNAITLPDLEPVIEKGLRYLENMRNRWGFASQAMRDMLHLLYQQIFDPLLAYLPEMGSRLILAPAGPLHLLPLSAARDPLSGRYLCQNYRVSVVPSLGALLAIHKEDLLRREEKLPENELLAVAYPGSEDEHDRHYLKSVTWEAGNIVKEFEHSSLIPPAEASVKTVLQQSGNARRLHFGCHGYYDPEYPANSGLLLKDGWLTVRRILSEMDLKNVEMVMLGACLSGRQKVSRGEELTGLLASFLAVKARSVAGTLWSVSDDATANLMVCFIGLCDRGWHLIWHCQPPRISFVRNRIGNIPTTGQLSS